MPLNLTTAICIELQFMSFVSCNGNQFTVWILPIKGVREENGIYHLEVVGIDELPDFSSSPLNVDPKPSNWVDIVCYGLMVTHSTAMHFQHF